MGHKPLLPLTFLLLFLAFAFLISSTAVPTTRVLQSNFDDPSAQPSVFQDWRDLEISGEDSLEFVDERLSEGRVVLENNDYPGTGANNHHDPKSPATKP
ncbi:hypothetical protein SDJN02_09627 [Cucurbita argyrosperma subsp. argyrosperma]